jgi:hypothetical protein
MATGLLLCETMSGDMTLSEDGVARPFAFSIRAFTTRIFSISAPRYFRGTVTLDGEEYACRGELTIFPSGPHYWLEFNHPQLGTVRAEGKKSYSMSNLLRSLTTCPLTVSTQGKVIGQAEVAFRDSMLAFPFKAFRLVDEERAFETAGSTS